MQNTSIALNDTNRLIEFALDDIGASLIICNDSYWNTAGYNNLLKYIDIATKK